jgi:hypothetical protein
MVPKKTENIPEMNDLLQGYHEHIKSIRHDLPLLLQSQPDLRQPISLSGDQNNKVQNAGPAIPGNRLLQNAYVTIGKFTLTKSDSILLSVKFRNTVIKNRFQISEIVEMGIPFEKFLQSKKMPVKIMGKEIVPIDPREIFDTLQFAHDNGLSITGQGAGSAYDKKSGRIVRIKGYRLTALRIPELNTVINLKETTSRGAHIDNKWLPEEVTEATKGLNSFLKKNIVLEKDIAQLTSGIEKTLLKYLFKVEEFSGPSTFGGKYDLILKTSYFI